jgi:hypothetical protein
MDLACRALVALGHLLGPLPPTCGVILATTRGSAASDRCHETARRAGAIDPQRFPYTLPTAPIGEARIRLGLRGTGIAVLGGDDTLLRALAGDLLADGCPAVLVAWIDCDAPPHHARAELWSAGTDAPDA